MHVDGAIRTTIKELPTRTSTSAAPACFAARMARCGSALTPALNVDGLNLIQAQAAKARGLSVPPSLLARAEEMIE